MSEATQALAESKRYLRTVEGLNLALVLSIAVLCWIAGGSERFMWGVLVGGGLSAFNFAAMVWLGRRIVTVQLNSRGLYVLLLVAKLGLLGAAIWAALTWLPVSIFGFLTGVSVIMPAMMLARLRSPGLSELHNSRLGQEG